MSTPPQGPVVLIVRHAEKPSDGGPHGVDHHGRPTPHGLIPQGWSRAGALAVRLDRAGYVPDDPLVRPDRVYATASSGDHPSDRPRLTAKPIAERLGVPLHDHFGRGDEPSMAAEIISGEQPTLIVWDHGHIPVLAKEFPLAAGVDVPAEWPGDRYDLVWALRPGADGYSLTILPQDLLAGDAPAP